MSALLEVRGLEVGYGPIEAVQGIDFDVNAGEIRTLVGANGAGKSTTLLALSGLVRARRGSIRFDGVELSRLTTHQIVERGLVQVAEGRAILTTLTVRENLELGAYRRRDRARGARRPRSGAGVSSRGLPSASTGWPATCRAASSRCWRSAGRCWHGPGCCCSTSRRWDWRRSIVQDIFRTLREINARDGLTIFLVEQNVRQALKIAAHGYVIESGKIVLQGSGSELLDDPRVLAAYLGG